MYYSPTERLLAVLELLQSNKRMSGTEISQRLEVDVRTVRRYITSLQNMGIPIEGERGPSGAYTLQRGHRLPPLLYTEEEAVALVLGLIVLQAFHFPVDVVTVEGALAKTERVVPEVVFRRIQSLRNAIVFNSSIYIAQSPQLAHNQFIVTLASAVQDRQRVHMRYRSWEGKFTERMVDPYGLVYNEGYWYAVGHCHLRHDVRTFRLDRVYEVLPLSDTFERMENFDPLNYVLKSIALSPNLYSVEIVLHTSMDVAQSFFSPKDGTFEQVDNRVIFRRNVVELEWLAYLLLSAPFRIRVIHPLELRQVLHEISAKALEMSVE
jgi:predicted DNA-binding transcriptional regulator YafY